VVLIIHYRVMGESISEMKLSQSSASVTARFDDEHLIGYAGLVPAMRLASQAGLYDLVGQHVRIRGDHGANASLKIGSLVAGMVAGADSISDMDVVRHGGMSRLFAGMRAPSTLGSFLRAATFGHARQVDAVGSRFTVGLDHTSRLFGSGRNRSPVWVDMDDTVVPVFSPHKQGAAIGYTKTRGLDALIMTATAEDFAPVIIANQLRKGSANSARGAAQLASDGLALLRRSSVNHRQAWFRADSGFYGHELITRVMATRAWVSVTVRLTGPVQRAIMSIPDSAWTQIEYPHPVVDPESGEQISRAEVAETTFDAFSSRPDRRGPIPGRLVVRRIPDWRATQKTTAGQDPLWAAWRYHAFFTTVPTDSYDTVTVDKIHRGHAVVEQVHSALKNGALAHLPCAKFAANKIWLTLACLSFNLVRALATLTTNTRFTMATPATIQSRLICIPARITTSARRIILHLPQNWKWATSWMTMFTTTHTRH